VPPALANACDRPLPSRVNNPVSPFLVTDPVTLLAMPGPAINLTPPAVAGS
jgi:hypothetical protein